MPSVWGGAGGTGSQGARESKLKARDVVTEDQGFLLTG